MRKGGNRMDLLLNALIAGITLSLLLFFSRKGGSWNPGNLRKAFCFFTVQSNVLCAAGALLMCFAPQSVAAWLLKYLGTAAVTVTMLTVLCFLGPSMGYGDLLKGADLCMHLITPLLALISFCVFERRHMSFPLALLGLLPTVLYGGLYCYKLFLAPRDKAWQDFYGFNRGGKWPVSLACMLLGSLLICVGLMCLQNL